MQGRCAPVCQRLQQLLYWFYSNQQPSKGDIVQFRQSVFFALVALAAAVPVAFAQSSPVLTVTSNVSGTSTFEGLNNPPLEITVIAGREIVLSWLGDASAYGGTIDAYRFGWDILDLNDPEQWEIEFTPNVLSAVPRTFFFGTHTFHVDVRDTDGNVTRGSFHYVTVQPTPVEERTWGGIKAVYSED